MVVPTPTGQLPARTRQAPQAQAMGQPAATAATRGVITAPEAATDGRPTQAAVQAIRGTVRTVPVALQMVTPATPGTRTTVTAPLPTVGMAGTAMPAIAATASRAA